MGCHVREVPEGVPCSPGSELKRRLTGELPANWDAALPNYTPKDSAVATRKLSEAVLQHIYSVLPELIGGSADLTPSNLTRWKEAVDSQPPSSGAEITPVDTLDTVLESTV